jgi:hypothetical protein
MIDFDHIGESLNQILGESGTHHFADTQGLFDALGDCGIDVSDLSDAQLESLFSHFGDASAVADAGSNLDLDRIGDVLSKLPDSVIKFGASGATCGSYNLH